MDYLKFKEEADKLNTEKAKLVKQFILDGLRPIFDKYPKVTSIGWTQYAPYFNDGDACVFSVHTDNIYINEISMYDSDDELEDEGIENIGEISDEVTLLLDKVDQDDFEREFGNDCKVTITRDGEIEIGDTNHD